MATRKQKLFWIAIVLSVGALFLVRCFFFFQSEQSETLVTHVGESAEVVGMVVADPDRRDTSLHLTVDVETVGGVSTSGKLLALVPRESSVSFGDVVTVRGPITLPESFEGNAGRIFDYPGYLRVQGISAQMSRAELVRDTSGGFSIQRFLFSIKHTFEHSLQKLLPEPDESLLEGILLGERHGIPKDLTNAFIESGLIHVVVLSGYNITIVAEGVFRLLSFLPTSASYPIGGILMIFFAVMTGAGSTTLRALIMGLIALLARYLHRSALAMRSLIFAGVVMIFWNPEVLLHDPSFMLSMLATFGLITLSPTVEHWLGELRLFRYKRMQGAKSIAASTIAVEIVVLPALLYQTGVLSLLSIPANVLALPVVPAAMLAGFVAGLTNLVPAPLGQLLAFIPTLICDILLKWMLLITTAVAATPFGAVTIPAFSFWLALLLYIPILWFAIGRYKRTSVVES